MRETTSAKIRRRARVTASTAALWSVDKLAFRFGLRNAASLSLPDFLGIGAQKAGSTWLWSNLRRHPDLFLPAIKELHYFDLHFYIGLAKYASYFDGAEGKIKGEITPAYGVLSPQKIKFVRRIAPAIKLIFILRNPIERAWSRAKMVLREPGDTRIDIGSFSERRLHRAIAHSSSLARGDYLTVIDNWLRHFPPNQLHVCFFDDLVQHPRSFLGEIFTFLGVRTDVDWSQFPFASNPNPTPNTKIPFEVKQKLEKIYCAKIEALYQRFGSKVAGWRCT